jgi:predicted HTH domain antitoxin
MAAITIDFPDSIQQNLEKKKAMPRFILEAVALEGYRQESLSQRQVGELLGMNFWETEAFLKAHEVYLHYDLEDFSKDMQTMERIRQKQ